ncbi:hypothetical protein FQN54_002542 [Arachnomyces sp. PD_36]|nr:hypothetical protein FQN54_002542 [Arachnomyces sp. PD_36]
MRFSLSSLAAVSGALLFGSTLAAPTPRSIQDYDVSNLLISSDNTLNGTKHTGGPAVGGQSAQLPLELVNNLAGGAVNAYVTGLDSDNSVVMLQADGSWFYPTAGGAEPEPVTADIAIPLGAQGSVTNLTLPSYVSSGRVWFAEGELAFFTVQTEGGGVSLVQPSAANEEDASNGLNWGFVELTNIAEGGLYANISYVDFVGLILGMKLETESGDVQNVAGLPSDAVSLICDDLAAQGSSDGQPWGELCVTGDDGSPIRALAPTDYLGRDPEAFSDYFTSYVDEVWSNFGSTPLTIDTQADAGMVECTAGNGTALTCDGDNRGYEKPNAEDIFGCNSGPFGILEGDNDVHKAIVPRLCAAFVRTTFLVEGGEIQPGPSEETYYTEDPTNHYSRIVHEHEIDGKGYAFAYDDVNPEGKNAAGVVAAADPKLLTVTIGGPSQ